MTSEATQSRASRMGIAIAVIAAAAISAGIWAFRPTRDNAEQLLAEASDYRRAGEFAAAEQAAAQALSLKPQAAAAALMAAECAAEQDAYDRAVDYVRRIPPDAADSLRRRGALLAAEIQHTRTYNLTDAENWYREVLQVDPDSPAAHEGLAKLLGLCGRGREAVPHVLSMVKAGADTDLLIMISRTSGAVADPETLELARAAHPDDPNVALGLAWIAEEELQYDQAAQLLQLAATTESTSVQAALGRILLAQDRIAECGAWSNQLPPEADSSADVWLVRARLAERAQREDSAARCYWEAARIAPESKTAITHLTQLLDRLGFPEAALRCADHLRAIERLETLQNRALFSGSDNRDLNLALQLITAYQDAGRLWEAYGWCRMIARSSSASALTARLTELTALVDGLPLQQTADAANPALAVDLSHLERPTFGSPAANPEFPATDDVEHRFVFHEQAAAHGLTFQYNNGTGGGPPRHMHEFSGGGIGVADYDRDRCPDVLCTQGVPGDGDTLFRNTGGKRFEDVTEFARYRSQGFGQGVTVGDFDADGFPDLYVATIRENRLWRNNGDGTYTDWTEQAQLADAAWTTSCVMADLDGDALPDIYDANYLSGEDVFERICRHPDGSPRHCMPFTFDGAPDRLLRNGGDGVFMDATAELPETTRSGKGLGVVAWRPTTTSELCLFVACDTTPNLFLNRTAGEPARWQDSAIVSGLALNDDGKAEGCMGIAIGDVDGDGLFDLHVTNFLAESNTFYRAAPGITYRDETRPTGLELPTLDLLGFGTQFLDINFDAVFELFLTNGHVDDLPGKPYRMRPQLFAWDGIRFLELRSEQLGDYFTGEWLGRAVALLDWNGDGPEDILIGHLDTPVALLTNATPDIGRHLTLDLSGRHSERDAIGTIVTATCGERTLVRQLTAGDGYQASNERHVVIGVGAAEQIDLLTVDWPSSLRMEFRDVPVSAHACIVEGRGLFALP